MINVMIVDDEVLVRVGLKTVIDWEKHGFCVVGEASNGRDALAMLKKQKIDVILLDIKMPIMGGIELLRIIHEEKFPVKVIILSCYDDFEYVREAMKLGAYDYVLKLSLDVNKLTSILDALKRELFVDDVDEDYQAGTALKEYHLALLKNQEKFSWPKMRGLGSKLNESPYYILYVSIDCYQQQIDSGIIKNPTLFGRFLVNTISDIINNYSQGDCFEKRPGHYLAFVNPRTSSPQLILEMCEHIFDSSKRYSQCVISIGVSEKIEDYAKIRNGYLQAKWALERRFFKCAEVICSAENSWPSRKEGLILYTEELEGKLRVSLETLDYAKTINTIDSVFQIAYTETNLEREVVLSSVDNIVASFAKELRFHNKYFNDIPEFKGVDLASVSRSFDYLCDLEQWLNCFTKTCFDFLVALGPARQRLEIAQVIQYIEQHYSEEISLTHLARHVNLSEGYLSHLFKQETGQGIANHILNYRLKLGKQLLRSTDLKVYEIAERVGYSNVHYFSSAFKKTFGSSPTEYQKTIRIASENIKP